MKFQELKINQEFRTSNGRPAVKVSQDSAKSLVAVCVSPSTNQYEENYVFSVKPEEVVYNVKELLSPKEALDLLYSVRKDLDRLIALGESYAHFQSAQATHKYLKKAKKNLEGLS